MRLMLAALAVMCCGAVPVRHSLWKTYLYFENTNPAVIRIPKPGINFVFDTYDAEPIARPMVNSISESPVPSPVLVKRLHAPTALAEVPKPLGPTYQRSSVPVPVLLRPEPVETPEDTDVTVPGKILASDVHVNNQEVMTSPVASSFVVVTAPEPLEAPEPPMPSLDVPFVGGQFHTQDELKQYSFGHWGGPSTRVETRDALGRTHGSFAYVDPLGEVQVRKYAAAPAMGFKVAASDLPVDTPQVARLKAAHEQAHRTFLSFRDEVA